MEHSKIRRSHSIIYSFVRMEAAPHCCYCCCCLVWQSTLNDSGPLRHGQPVRFAAPQGGGKQLHRYCWQYDAGLVAAWSPHFDGHVPVRVSLRDDRPFPLYPSLSLSWNALLAFAYSPLLRRCLQNRWTIFGGATDRQAYHAATAYKCFHVGRYCAYF